MWGSRKKKVTRIDSLIGQNTEIKGNITFSGGLHVDGIVKGNIFAKEETSSILTLSEQGSIKGEIKVPNMILNGVVMGDVYASEHIELAPNARITGNVYYNLIEMAMGAEVNGNLVHNSELEQENRFSLEHDQGEKDKEILSKNTVNI